MRRPARMIAAALAVAATGVGCAPSEFASQFLHGRDTLADERRASETRFRDADAKTIIPASAVAGLGNAFIR